MEHTAQTSIHPSDDGDVGVIAAISKAITLIHPVAKDSQFKGAKAGSYPYRSTDALWNALSRPIGEAGLAIIPSSQLVLVPSTQGGQIGQCTALRVNYMIAASDGSYISTSIEMITNPTRPQDIGAAMSYAAKYVLSQTFSVPFDDPATEFDADVERHEAAVAEAVAVTPPVDASDLLARLKAASDPVKALFREQQAVQVKHGRSWSFADIHAWSQAEYDAASGYLERLLADEEPSVEYHEAGTPNEDATASIAKLSNRMAALELSWDDVLAFHNEHSPKGMLVDTQEEALTNPAVVEAILRDTIPGLQQALAAAAEQGKPV